MGAAAAGLIVAAPAESSGIQYGYAAMTWGKEEKQAIDDIAAAGFAGVQFRADALTEFQPSELKDRLAEHKLKFVALSSGDISLDEDPAGQLAKHTSNARFVRDAGRFIGDSGSAQGVSKATRTR